MTNLYIIVKEINHEPDFEKKQGMLKVLNMVFETHYDLLNGRVTRYDGKYTHDVWTDRLDQ